MTWFDKEKYRDDNFVRKETNCTDLCSIVDINNFDSFFGFAININNREFIMDKVVGIDVRSTTVVQFTRSTIDGRLETNDFTVFHLHFLFCLLIGYGKFLYSSEKCTFRGSGTSGAGQRGSIRQFCELLQTIYWVITQFQLYSNKQ